MDCGASECDWDMVRFLLTREFAHHDSQLAQDCHVYRGEVGRDYRREIHAVLNRTTPGLWHKLPGACVRLDEPAWFIRMRTPTVSQHLDDLSAQGVMWLHDPHMPQICNRFGGSMLM